MADFKIENSLEGLVAGIDEAGRGPLCGPVVAAAVIFLKQDQDFIYEINDSKKLSKKKRSELYKKIINNDDIIFSQAIVSNDIIDNVNIFNATKIAMQQAYDRLKLKADHILIDGKFKMINSENAIAVIKGDSLSLSIAAASIIAKQVRDNIMLDLDALCPEYKWSKNQGYGTKEHLEAIDKFGVTKYHRFSFSPIKNKA